MADTRSIGAQPGDKLSVLLQLALDGVTRPLAIYQINDGAVQNTKTVTADNTQPFASASTLYLSTNLFESDFYEGRIYRAAVWHDGPMFNTFAASVMRDFVNADGSLVDRATSVATYGTPVHELDMTVPAINSGTNLGSGGAFTLSGGPLSLGITSAFFDLNTTVFDEGLAAGATVATIETNGVPVPQYQITSDPSGLFAISGQSVVRTAAAATHDGSFDPITIRETQSTGTKDRTFRMFAARTGEDAVFGRLSITASRTSVFTGEHIFFSLDGLTDEEAALLFVDWDFGDSGEVYDNLPAGYFFGNSARYKSGPYTLKTFTGTTGLRTVTVNVYRAGSAAPVWTGTIDITVLDPATITNVHVVSASENYAGLPAGTQHISISEALTAAWAQVQNGENALVHLRRGDEWLSGNDVTMRSDTNDPLGSLLIRPAGTGADPIVRFGQGGESIKVRGSNDNISVSAAGIDPRGLVDTLGLVDANGVSTYNYRTAFMSSLSRGHVTLSRITGRGIMQFTQDGQSAADTASCCLHDCLPVQYAPYAYYFGYARRSGLDGGTFVKKNEPNISKRQFAAENAAPGNGLDNIISINGPGRAAIIESMVISRVKSGSFQGWSDGNTAFQLRDRYTAAPLSAHQPNHRLASDQPITGGTLHITECEVEGFLNLQNFLRSFGRFIITRNHFTGHAGASTLFSADHRGLWFVSNVLVMANTPSETANPGMFIKLDTRAGANHPGAEDADNIRQRIIGNTFVDLRTAAQLQPGESGTIASMFAGIDNPAICQCENNVIYVPNRAVSDPGIPGLTVVSSLDTDVVASVNYRGLWSPLPGNYNPVDLGAVDTDYATPATSGVSGRVPAGSVIIDTWAGRLPAADIGGNKQTDTSRSPGAWADVA